jgi:hypothetical protein
MSAIAAAARRAETRSRLGALARQSGAESASPKTHPTYTLDMI